MMFVVVLHVLIQNLQMIHSFVYKEVK